MVKYIPSSRNKKLSAIREGFKGQGPYAAEIKKSFPPTNFLCNSKGKLIYYEGEYSYEKHLRAYDRAKLWLPSIVDGKLLWKKNPFMKPFCRLFNAKPDLDIVNDELRKKPPSTHRTLWNGAVPPMQVGMIGEFKGEPAIVTDKGFKTSKRRRVIGIGDPENIFLRVKELNMLGIYTEEIQKPTWTIATSTGTREIYNNSRCFKRKNRVIQDFDPKKHLKKYLKVAV
jgi:hypothetical protein